MKKIFSMANIIMPTIIFYWIFKIWGIIFAAMISVLYNGMSLGVQFRKSGTISNTSVIGLLGLIGSAIAIYFTGNEKYYYIPALAINIITFCFLCVLSGKKKSVLHYLAKDFDIKAITQIPQDNLQPVNILWLIFFGLKIITKVIGIFYMDFEKLYWLVFLMGDPAMIIMILLSIMMIKIQSKK